MPSFKLFPRYKPGKRFTSAELSNMIVCMADQSNGKTKVLGTAIILSHKNDYYLLTACSVIEAIIENCVLIFKAGNDQPIFIPLSFFTIGLNSKWIKHDTADLAVTRIDSFDDDSAMRLEKWSFPSSQISTSREALKENCSALVLAYPLIDEVGDHFSHLSFHSHCASGLITLKRTDTKSLSTFQILENPAIQYSKGAPVFINYKTRERNGSAAATTLAGLVYGVYPDNIWNSVSIFTPSFYISSLLP